MLGPRFILSLPILEARPLASFFFVFRFLFLAFCIKLWIRALLLAPHLSAIFFCFVLSQPTCQSIWFQLYDLDFDLLQFLGLINKFSADEYVEIFACVLLTEKFIYPETENSFISRYSREILFSTMIFRTKTHPA